MSTIPQEGTSFRLRRFYFERLRSKAETMELHGRSVPVSKAIAGRNRRVESAAERETIMVERGAHSRLFGITSACAKIMGWKAGGHDRDRTCDPYHVKVVLSR
jgi:hypothetical protein